MDEEGPGGDDDIRIATWVPVGQAECDEATRLVAVANQRSWRTYAELLARPPQPGRWLLRYRLGPIDYYTLPLDEEHLFFRNGDQKYMNKPYFATDPRDAAVMTWDRAIELLPRLMEKFDLTEMSDAWFEPVQYEDVLGS